MRHRARPIPTYIQGAQWRDLPYNRWWRGNALHGPAVCQSDFYRDPGPTYHICNRTVDHGELRFRMLKLTLNGTEAKWAVRDSFVSRAGKASQAAVGR